MRNTYVHGENELMQEPDYVSEVDR